MDGGWDASDERDASSRVAMALTAGGCVEELNVGVTEVGDIGSGWCRRR